MASLLLLSFFSFLAGFIDSVVGGGGLVQMPAIMLLYPNLSVSNLVGTNRLASAAGTSIAVWNYARSVAIPWKIVLYAGTGAGVASFLGALVQNQIPIAVFKPLLLVIMVAILIFTYREKQIGQQESLKFPPEKMPFAALGIGLVLGLYNGLIGPGTGSLLVFAFVSVTGFHFLRASGIAKVVNLSADVASLVFFISGKYVLFQLALPMLVCNVAGAYFGSRMAVLRGNAFVRRFFLVVIGAIVLRFAWEVIR